MAILNKKKYFNKIYFSIFEKSMRMVNELNSIMTYYGAKPIIEKKTDRFIISSFFICLYFLEGILQKNYYDKYSKEVNMIIDAMIYELSNRLNMKQEVLTDIYLFVRGELGKISTDKTLQNVDPLAYASTFYLELAFEDDYNPELHGFEFDEVSIALEKLFGDFLMSNIKI